MTTMTQAEAKTVVRSRTLNDPEWFFRSVLGVQRLYDKQVDIMTSVRDGSRVAVLGANGTGKDWTSARIMLWWMSTHYPAKVIVVGPTHRQVSDIVFSEARKGFNQARYPLDGVFLETSQWKLGDDHYARGFATSDPYNVLGFHSPNLLVIVTEAHNMPQAHIDNIKLLLPKCILMTGNPFCSTGEFYDAFNDAANQWETIRISVFDTPNLQEGREVIPGMATVESVKQMTDDWKEKQPAMYSASVLGEFADNLEDTLIARSVIMAAVERELEPPEDEPVSFSLDVARFGSDRSVVYRRKGDQCRKVLDVQGHDTQQLAGEVALLAEEEPEGIEVLIIVDDTGVGGGVTDRLNEESGKIRGGSCRIIPFNGGEKADDDLHYANAVAEAWMELANALRDGNVDLDDNPAVVAQLASRRTRIQGDRRLALEKKDDYKKRTKRSPDDADALAMAYSPLCGSPAFRFFDF